jgi:hypothetical protein
VGSTKKPITDVYELGHARQLCNLEKASMLTEHYPHSDLCNKARGFLTTTLASVGGVVFTVELQGQLSGRINQLD